MDRIFSWAFVYWKPLAFGLAILTIAMLAFLWKNSHDKRIREEERQACNLEWNIKNTEAQAAFDKAINEIKTKQKAAKVSTPADKRTLLIELRQGSAFR